MGRLNILPNVYYDLTPSETGALLHGAEQRDVFQLRNTRIVATLLRNAHFSKPVTETEFMPLPGDEALRELPPPESDPEALFAAFASAFGVSPTIEYH